MATDSAAAPTGGKGLHIALWIAQVIVGLGSIASGLFKVFADLDQPSMTFVPMLGHGFVRFIGVAEALGGVGLIVPSATRIKPILTPIAAVGLIVILIGAVGVHLKLGENNQLGAPLVLIALNAFIAWGRFKKAPIPPRA